MRKDLLLKDSRGVKKDRDRAREVGRTNRKASPPWKRPEGDRELVQHHETCAT